ncbi:MAG: TIGR00730 family Rossman fold protein [Candidatus Liptonbacteria bacterium]|nr:TIGR00730 family Rossman fold protein [Candidatus Liptonbacteria bacterium]
MPKSQVPPVAKKSVKSETKPRINYLFPAHQHDVSPWRIFKIMAEFVNGFEFLRQFTRAVSFFGSARVGLEPRMYTEATKLARMFADAGFAVVTGGGPGIMQAANKGAFEAGGRSIGLNIKLPFEQRTNKYVTDAESFEYFFSRKVMLSFAAHAYIFFPGGYGTLNEMFEMVELVQTKKIEPLPIVLVGRDFWTPLLDWLKTVVLDKTRGIEPEDLAIIHVADNAEEAFRTVVRLIQPLKR